MKRAHIFDMDGTLLVGTTAPLEIAAVTGATEELEALEEDFRQGQVTTIEFAERLVQLWGIVSDEVTDKAFNDCPKMDDIGRVVEDLHHNGDVACIITMSPDFFADRFKSFGFDAIFASQFPTSLLTKVESGQILSPSDKPVLAEVFCQMHELHLTNAVGYGDSMSDVELFMNVGLSVSVNGDKHVRDLAHIHVESQSLWDPYTAALALCREHSGLDILLKEVRL